MNSAFVHSEVAKGLKLFLRVYRQDHGGVAPSGGKSGENPIPSTHVDTSLYTSPVFLKYNKTVSAAFITGMVVL